MKGFTLIQLIAVIGALVWLGVVGTIIYVIAHFVLKFWQ